MLWPVGLMRVYAMARPRRPDAERDAVRTAVAEWDGSAAAMARSLARRVVALAMAEIDGDPTAKLIALVKAEPIGMVETLATCPDIDTGALIRAARLKRMEARGWRHLPEREWPTEDRAVAKAACAILAARYARHLRD